MNIGHQVVDPPLLFAHTLLEAMSWPVIRWKVYWRG
jgi:hypothetical protein